MSAARIQKLKSLLERVERRKQEPRLVARQAVAEPMQPGPLANVPITAAAQRASVPASLADAMAELSVHSLPLPSAPFPSMPGRTLDLPTLVPTGSMPSRPLEPDQPSSSSETASSAASVPESPPAAEERAADEVRTSPTPVMRTPAAPPPPPEAVPEARVQPLKPPSSETATQLAQPPAPLSEPPASVPEEEPLPVREASTPLAEEEPGDEEAPLESGPPAPPEEELEDELIAGEPSRPSVRESGRVPAPDVAPAVLDEPSAVMRPAPVKTLASAVHSVSALPQAAPKTFGELLSLSLSLRPVL